MASLWARRIGGSRFDYRSGKARSVNLSGDRVAVDSGCASGRVVGGEGAQDAGSGRRIANLTSRLVVRGSWGEAARYTYPCLNGMSTWCGVEMEPFTQVSRRTYLDDLHSINRMRAKVQSTFEAKGRYSWYSRRRSGAGTLRSESKAESRDSRRDGKKN